MPYLTCPNCGTSVTDAGFESAPRGCPDCCAQLHPSAEVAWQSPPPQLDAAARRRVWMALVADRAAPASARGALESSCAHDLDPEVLTVARLLASELVTNAVTHAASVDGRRTQFSVWVSPQHLRVEVADDGAGFRPHPRSAGQELEGGWGLQLVESMADRWGVTVGGATNVWFDLALSSGVPAAH
jgi:anti-sigma regulatory factor (Ser/Thr protein kinase)